MSDATRPRLERTPKWDVAAGGVIVLVGGIFLYFGSGLRPGTLGRMGPGFVPISVSCIVIALGAIIIFNGLRKPAAVINWPALRPLLVVLACPILFALLIGKLGLVLTILIVASIARLAEPQRFGIEAIAMPILLAIFCVVLFSYLLSLSIPLWPQL